MRYKLSCVMGCFWDKVVLCEGGLMGYKWSCMRRDGWCVKVSYEGGWVETNVW